MNDHDDLLARPERLRRLADYATPTEKSMALRAAADEIERLRAALAARPQPLFEGPVDKLTVWLRDQDRNPDPMIVPEWWSGVVLYPAVAGSATPTQPDPDTGGATWECEDCGRTFPIAEPPMGAECDNCGGVLLEAAVGQAGYRTAITQGVQRCP